MIKHIPFTLYPVTDMARARRFYEEMLGLRLIRREVRQFEWVEYDFPKVYTGTIAVPVSMCGETSGLARPKLEPGLGSA
jgi:catechol 2,3-dioxygenase-like lactoylglutathione lyase family enzyme